MNNLKSLSIAVMLCTWSSYGLTNQNSSFLPAQMPLDTREAVAPNLVVTLDASASMKSNWNTVWDLYYWIGQAPEMNSLAFDHDRPWIPSKQYVTPWKVLSTNGTIFNNYPLGGLYEWNERTGVLKVSTDGYNPNAPKRSYTLGHYFLNSYVYKPSCGNEKSIACYKAHPIQIDNEHIRKQFIIWHAFYRERGIYTKTQINLNFMNMPEEIRLTWQDLQNCKLKKDIYNPTGACNTQWRREPVPRADTVRKFEGVHKNNFYAWLNGLDFKTGSYIAEAMVNAGEFLKKPENYGSDRQDHTFGHPVGCRQNYHMIFTDAETTDAGYVINGAYTPHGKPIIIGNITNEAKTFPDDVQYNGTRYPYQSGKYHNAISVANVAFFYWSIDLLPNVDYGKNNVVPYKENNDYWDPRNDPATWQHMVNFPVGIGLASKLTGHKYDLTVPIWNKTLSRPSFGFLRKTNDGLYHQTSWYGPDWRSWKAAELWHAAIVSRGEFYSVDDDNGIQRAISRLTARLESASNKSSQPMTTVSSTRDGDKSSSFIFSTRYSTKGGWSGDLTAAEVVPAGVSKGISWSLLSNINSAVRGSGWKTRRVKTIGSNGALVDFTFANLTSEQKKSLSIDPTSDDYRSDGWGEARVNFIRGDQSNANGGIFRTRTNQLGDILNSRPVYVRDARYLVSSINWNESEKSAYKDFQAKQNIKPAHVYVGANDGMLHAVNVKTGKEVFAYVPKAVIPYLNKLTSPLYGANDHRYYVDGKLTVADVYIDNSWKTILVGTLGAGGQGIFALDITTPGENGAGIKLLWDLDSSDFAETKGKLGYTYATPSIVRFNDGKWKVVFGNGPASDFKDSVKGYASLFVLDAKTGKLEREYVVHNENNENKENGLFAPKIISLASTGTADVAYAGDLQGNLWRFDLTTSPSSINTKPLFTATKDGKDQSITVAPLVFRHPKQEGFIIAFGTGRYITAKDTTLFGGQDFYGIWDPLTTASGIHPGTIRRG